MSNIASLTTERERRETEAWERYVAARNVAEATLRVEDGIAAGRAWRTFLDLFLSPTQAATMGADVVPMRARS